MLPGLLAVAAAVHPRAHPQVLRPHWVWIWIHGSCRFSLPSQCSLYYSSPEFVFSGSGSGSGSGSAPGPAGFSTLPPVFMPHTHGGVCAWPRVLCVPAATCRPAAAAAAGAVRGIDGCRGGVATAGGMQQQRSITCWTKVAVAAVAVMQG